jgi:hypothetical protein
MADPQKLATSFITSTAAPISFLERHSHTLGIEVSEKMIWESHYWKDDLLKIAKRLDKRNYQKKWLQSSLAKIEQDVMLGFYIVRKLREAKKLSDSIADLQLNLKAYPSRGNEVTRRNWFDFEELYDFSKPNGQTRYLGFICDQIIHSYIFAPEFNDDKIRGILFCSDKKRNTQIYSLSLSVIIDTFTKVGNNYPSKSVYSLNEDTGDYEVSNT